MLSKKRDAMIECLSGTFGSVMIYDDKKGKFQSWEAHWDDPEAHSASFQGYGVDEEEALQDLLRHVSGLHDRVARLEHAIREKLLATPTQSSH